MIDGFGSFVNSVGDAMGNRHCIRSRRSEDESEEMAAAVEKAEKVLRRAIEALKQAGKDAVNRFILTFQAQEETEFCIWIHLLENVVQHVEKSVDSLARQLLPLALSMIRLSNFEEFRFPNDVSESVIESHFSQVVYNMNYDVTHFTSGTGFSEIQNHWRIRLEDRAARVRGFFTLA